MKAFRGFGGRREGGREGGGKRGLKKEEKDEKRVKQMLCFCFCLSCLGRTFDVVYRVDQREEINTNIFAV